MTLADPIVNVTSAAALYSQIAGVLAGFAFTGLTFYLIRRTGETGSGTPQGASDSESRERAVALALVSTLIALVIVSVLYAILAGGPDTSGASYLGIIIYGTAFALAILSMFHSIGLLATESRHLRDVILATKAWTIIVGPTVALVLVSSAALDIFYFRCGSTCDTSTQLALNRPFGLGMSLSAVLFVTSIISAFAFRRGNATSHLRQALPAVLVIAVALAAAFSAVILLMLPSSFVPSDGQVSAILVASFGLCLLFSILTAASYPRPRAPATDDRRIGGA